ncbi:hypothetical protein TSUD_54020 [Trifolium subterraneum]|uniref:CCHC-type domain-containing protein n=1 Tax=Trifolium subterraneum TaxID=3900 RepID=A0A2Z6NIR7_TRISU|nr:hypothetical protein TSUD_54020 [Trifolium subterraneum]
MRVKVRVDVRSPLKIEKKIKLNGGKGGVVKFKYEKLGLFCFVCGRLGHAENKCEVKYAMERDDGQRRWSNELKAEVRRPGGRVGSRWLHEEGRNMVDVDASNTSGERGSQQTGPTQTNVASPRESRGPENGGIVSIVRGHIPPLRPASARQSSSIQGSFIEAPVVSLISNRPILAITNDNTTTTQLTITPALNEGNQLDPDAMDTQVERKRRRAASLVAKGSEVRTHQHFLSAAIDVESRSGGLTVFWKDSSKCRVLNYTRNFINMLVEDEQWGEWRLTCYYGYPEWSRRRAAWDILRDLGNMSSIPWCIIGDFNDLLSQADKKGIHPHPNGLCMGFRQAVSDCDLTDIPIEGHPFTWIKSRGTPHVIEERLGGRENLEVVDRVTRCDNKLQRWGKKKRIRYKEEIDECVKRMNELRGNQDEEGSMQYQELSKRHATLLIQEEGYWKQRAKMHWLQEGDMNTKFFHMLAIVRSKKKKVKKLIADNGTEAHTQEELCEVDKSYFDTLFKPKDGDHDHVLNLIQPQVTDDDNFVLTAPIKKVEIQQALFQMHPDKSPGPDGFNPAFYQRGDLHGVKICRGAPEVSHILFADDCFLFYRANVAEVNELMRILHTYDTTSGQEVNLVKSEVFISRNMSQAAKEDLSRILGVKLVLALHGVVCGKLDKFFLLDVGGGLGVGIIFGLRMTLGCVGVLIDGCPRLNQQDAAEKILETPLVSSVATNIMLWAIGMVFGKFKFHTRHVIYNGAYVDDVSRLVLDCWKGACVVARDSWSTAGLSSVLHNATYQQTNAMDRIFAVCNNESSDTVGRVTMLLWYFWHNRNDKLWNDNVQMPRQIGRHAFDAWNDWYSVHKLQSTNVSETTAADLVRWEKPALDRVKCNVDVAFVSGSGRTSVGLCFRDNNGHFMADMTQ